MSLAYYLVDQGYTGDVLILDREQKSNNDRTWCWWSKSPTPFDSLFTHQWQYLKFADHNILSTQSIDPYRYCLLRSADFYHFIQQRLALAANVTWLQADIENIEDADFVYTDVWVSMGEEELREMKMREFDGFQVNRNLMKHCESRPWSASATVRRC